MVVAEDEEPGRGDLEKLRRAARRVPEGRHGHRRQRLVDQRRRGGAGAGGRGRRGGARLEAAGAHRAAAAGHAQAPEWFTTAPAGAIERLLARVGWKKDDVDLWEINEAFAVVSIANNRMLELDPARVNVWGGAVALGHPIGASGARVLVTLLAALRDAGKRRGVASLCIGGGEGIALAVELVDAWPATGCTTSMSAQRPSTASRASASSAPGRWAAGSRSSRRRTASR